LTQSLLQEASPRVRETSRTTRKSSEGRTTCLLCCSSLTRGFNAVNRSPQVTRAVLQLKPMQVCFVRGVGLPCSHARHLAHKAPVSSRTLRDSREPAGTHMKANGSELESRKSWSCQASQQGLCHGPKPLSDKQGRLGIARQPATGRDMELRDSNSIRDESHAKFRHEFCWRMPSGGPPDVEINALICALDVIS
jgi:hypothetical protein